MSMTLAQKQEKLKNYLLELGSVAVAFSSGVDSTFLLKTAHDVLGDKAIAITAHSRSFPARERDEADTFCKDEHIRQVVVEVDELAVEGFSQNPKNRCYLCKHNIFSKIIQAAADNDAACVAEGSNIDDEGDYRPGMQAIAELGVKSPLRVAGFTKADIRALSQDMGLPTWDKPSYACLVSRFPYGETITAEKLSMVDKAEHRLLDMGFRQMRVRIHGDIARIEVLPEDFPKLMGGDTPAQLNKYLQELGFTYVTLDLGGFQSGSMNRTLSEEEAAAAKSIPAADMEK